MRLYRMAVTGGKPQRLAGDRGAVTAFSVGRAGAIVYAMSTPFDVAQLYFSDGRGRERKLTDLNADIFRDREIASVDVIHVHQQRQ
ncbi:MAG TPA: hypothetical protein VFL57_09310 [Bryobacteraceae bacterium]|nr:hypothetical protein [Bryobacteraceae bacterium]